MVVYVVVLGREDIGVKKDLHSRFPYFSKTASRTRSPSLLSGGIDCFFLFNGMEMGGNYMWSNWLDGGNLVSSEGNIVLFSVYTPVFFPQRYHVRLRYGTV